MDKVSRIISFTAKTESGGKFDAWNPNDNNAGVSFGLIQFNQGKGRSGSPLAALFAQMHKRDPALFSRHFGGYASNLLDPKWVMAADLNKPELKALIKQSAALQPFQQAQIDMARKGYFDPVAPAAKQAGIKSERGHAMLFDAAVQMGPTRAARFAQEARSEAGPTAPEKQVLAQYAAKTDAFASKATGGVTERRQHLLVHPGLSDAALFGVGAVGVLLLAGGVYMGWRYFNA